jgi:DNA-binding transcriptional LysR family regulator
MTLTELQHKDTLAQLKYFGRASGRFKVRQATLSIAFNKLESELGIRLFTLSKNCRQKERHQAW